MLEMSNSKMGSRTNYTDVEGGSRPKETYERAGRANRGDNHIPYNLGSFVVGENLGWLGLDVLLLKVEAVEKVACFG
jgi:hypothetical protein